MSDSGKEQPQPSSKRTQRYRQTQVEQPKKRTLLKVLGIGGATAALGGIGLAWRTLSQSQGQTDISRPATPSKPTPTEDFLPRETIQYYQTRLRDLDQEILRNPQAFKEIAPRIGQLAIKYFCDEMGYDPQRYAGKLFYEWYENYNKLYYEKANCVQTGNVREDNAAFTSYSNQEIVFNLNASLYSDPKNKILRSFPSLVLFHYAIHELLHASAPTKTLEIREYMLNKDVEMKQRGIGVLIPRPESSSDTGVCYSNARGPMEEAIVEDATQRMMAKLGAQTNTPNYDAWVQRYRREVIDRLFGGDHMPLLRLHQQTNQDEFFILIGKKLGYSDNQRAGQEGEKHMLLSINQGIIP